jgi:hypothetical protein
MGGDVKYCLILSNASLCSSPPNKLVLIAKSPFLTNRPLLISILLHLDDNQTNLFGMIKTLSNLSWYTGLHLFKAFPNPTCRAHVIQVALLHVI